MADEIRRRSACDRCHSQKLRCPRRPGVAVCDRCLKAKASCLYSPFRQKRPIERNQRGSQGLIEQRSPYISDTTDSSPEGGVNGEQSGSKRRRPTEEFCNDYASNRSLESEAASQFVHSITASEMNIDYSFTSSHDFGTDSTFEDLHLGLQSPFPSFQNFNPLSPLFPPEIDPKSNSVPSFLGRASFPDMATQPESLLERLSVMETNLVDPASTIFVNMPLAIGWKFQEETLTLDSYSKCIGRLSVLSTELYEHSTTIPSLAIYEPNTPEEELDDAMNPPKIYRLDETFRVSQEMIDIYPTVLNVCSPRHQSNKATCFLGSPSNLDSSKSISVDHSTILLALSCHLRLIEIFDGLLTHMGICVETQGVSCTSYDKRVILHAPVVKIGNFEPPQASAVPMQMLLIVQLVSQLSNYASELVAKIKALRDHEKSIRDGVSDMSQATFALSLAAAENVSEKAKAINKTLAALRNQMLGSGLLA